MKLVYFSCDQHNQFVKEFTFGEITRILNTTKNKQFFTFAVALKGKPVSAIYRFHTFTAKATRTIQAYTTTPISTLWTTTLYRRSNEFLPNTNTINPVVAAAAAST